MFKSIRVFILISMLSILQLSNVFAESITHAPNQRFQILFSPHKAADTFMLDTQTGKVWQLTQFSDVNGEPVVWS